MQSVDECGYALREGESLGLPIAASSLGAAAEWLISRRLSWLLRWNTDPDRWIQLFLQLQRDGVAAHAEPDHMPTALPDDHATYQRYYWRVVLGASAPGNRENAVESSTR
jgi:hypothetical protein